MALKHNYAKELKKKILRELHGGTSIEELSMKYEVPEVVIKDWEDKEASEEYIEAIFSQSEIHNRMSASYKSWTLTNLQRVLKAKWLLGSLLAGVLSVVVVSFVCYGKAEFNVKGDPTLEISPKIDSLVISGHRIENKLRQQIIETKNLRQNITNITIYKPRKRTHYRKAPHRRNCCCCACTKNDTTKVK